MYSMVTTENKTALHISVAKVAKRVILKSYLRKKFATMCGNRQYTRTHNAHPQQCPLLLRVWGNF